MTQPLPLTLKWSQLASKLSTLHNRHRCQDHCCHRSQAIIITTMPRTQRTLIWLPTLLLSRALWEHRFHNQKNIHHYRYQKNCQSRFLLMPLLSLLLLLLLLIAKFLWHATWLVGNYSKALMHNRSADANCNQAVTWEFNVPFKHTGMLPFHCPFSSQRSEVSPSMLYPSSQRKLYTAPDVDPLPSMCPFSRVRFIWGQSLKKNV